MPAKLRRRNALLAFARAFQPDSPGVGNRLAALPRMIKATFKREYDGGGRLALMVLAGLYILSPIDVLPEAFFLIFGLIDDAFVVTWLTGAVLSETERFLEWEAGRKGKAKVLPGQVVG
jgi:uncharacterized membrane protein YkvA (DUF1232 family)